MSLFQGGSQTITPPVEKIGAYVLEASADGIKTATLYTVTDLALVQKVIRWPDAPGAVSYAKLGDALRGGANKTP